MESDPWRVIRHRYRWAIGLWAGWLPFGIVLGLVQHWILPARWAVGLAIAYLLTAWSAGILLAFSICPACDREFRPMTFSLKPYLPWSRRCQSCGARIGDTITPTLRL
jgi:hypothetical protein